MVSVQVDAVWKRCVVYKRDPDGLTIVIKAKSTPPGPNSTKASIQKMFISEVIKRPARGEPFDSLCPAINYTSLVAAPKHSV